ncbi:RtcB family protein [uncultured Ilyobacter sp.]|uniref:RtcB family protein n=1 Tax=uncultured Ilyobacter sp. TaxID=544433 RepID=UPI0029C61E04|nr:RtcB family protein [uncultured Ilyobacter sp.]
MDIKGAFNTARVFTDNIDANCIDQIKSICNLKIFKGKKIRVMPDVHAGKGSVIGLTINCGKNPQYIVPNIIGVDIGCGVLTVELGKIDVNFKSLDNFIRTAIPHGHNVNKVFSEKLYPEIFLNKIKKISKKTNTDYTKNIASLGSLGSGNHFIEIDSNSKGELFLLIHSGSRHFGHQIAQHHQKIADITCYKELPRDLKYLTGNYVDEYLKDMKFAEMFATVNRLQMAEKILDYLNINDVLLKETIYNITSEKKDFLRVKNLFFWETVHNYFDFEDGILRKGAVSAHKNEKLLIPFNMRDGAIIARGKGVDEWNYSAPHGAGRLMSRNKAKELLTLEEFKNSMDGIYTTSVSKKTLDEAPGAYKCKNDIINLLKNTVDIVDEILPLYNFKAE